MSQVDNININQNEFDDKEAENLSNMLKEVCDISKLMSLEGPIVKAVVLKCDGTAAEIVYDTTPKKHLVKEILGAPPTIYGEWEEKKVLVVGGRHESVDVLLNPHKLRFPFNDQEFRGDILLYRVNDEGTPEDFTLAEYEVFASQSDEDIEKAQAAANMAEAEEMKDEAEAEEYEEENPKQIEEEITMLIERQFEQKHGRKPTESERDACKQAVMQTFFPQIQSTDKEEDDADDNVQAQSDEIEELSDEEEESDKSGASEEQEEDADFEISKSELQKALENVRNLDDAEKREVCHHFF
ncbi:Signal recognition particle GTPase, FtsY [Reticulomyxa filosa]|uniref:Signal recognition particle GTPase, FtsY n=1 Tax=Reticulomyxa filosa TaxID=46433 RepID=X6PBJ4_RETFI|nr:Signal recognition particle GTPase, FtsY [Reticulomyxa filosa]|eukprot:ETO35488.1 Signal recognition particle GTPase, FtsY [Reticulomyxa filosa]